MNETNTPTALLLKEAHDGRVLEVELTGKLTAEDYHTFVPTVERMVKARGKISILVEMHDFHGWTPGAMWEDIKFDAKHFRDIERVAIVGENKWQRAMALFCKPFTAAKVRYFPRTRIEDARAWLVES